MTDSYSAVGMFFREAASWVSVLTVFGVVVFLGRFAITFPYAVSTESIVC